MRDLDEKLAEVELYHHAQSYLNLNKLYFESRSREKPSFRIHERSLDTSSQNKIITYTGPRGGCGLEVAVDCCSELLASDSLLVDWFSLADCVSVPDSSLGDLISVSSDWLVSFFSSSVLLVPDNKIHYIFKMAGYVFKGSHIAIFMFVSLCNECYLSKDSLAPRL